MISISSKGTQTLDFIKPNIIWKLTNKVKYIIHINGALIMFSISFSVCFPEDFWEEYYKN